MKKCVVCNVKISLMDQFKSEYVCPSCTEKGYWVDQHGNLQKDQEWMSNEAMRKHGIKKVW